MAIPHGETKPSVKVGTLPFSFVSRARTKRLHACLVSSTSGSTCARVSATAARRPLHGSRCHLTNHQPKSPNLDVVLPCTRPNEEGSGCANRRGPSCCAPRLMALNGRATELCNAGLRAPPRTITPLRALVSQTGPFLFLVRRATTPTTASREEVEDRSHLRRREGQAAGFASLIPGQCFWLTTPPGGPCQSGTFVRTPGAIWLGGV